MADILLLITTTFFGGKEIKKAPTYLSRDFKLVLRITSINISSIRTQTKKTFSFSKKITFLQVLKEVSSKQEELLKS